jgi:ubiquinone/menaquinone biosynthesis C-methylase UbiE
VKQKEIFLSGEGDEYYRRNLGKFASEKDLIIPVLDQIGTVESHNLKVLEVGCGQGFRLAELKKTKGWQVFGLDPSQKAVEFANSIGVEAKVGTADILPWADKSFDLVIFGFCLYLCDLDDLFTVAKECNRVLKDNAWVVILDFFAKGYFNNKYSHKEGVKSHKLNFGSMFDWHPFYMSQFQKIVHHENGHFTDQNDEWVAITVVRKNSLK